jgi:carbon monoxide dehydrogenase subunit G
MRIEGTYTFPAPIDQVFTALTHPDILSRIIPGCERLVQFGPASDDQPPVYELRLRRGPGTDVYTMTLTLSDAQAPVHLRVELDGHGPDGPVSGHGLVDLVQQEHQTVAASAWEIKSPVLAGMATDRRTAWNDSAEQFAATMRDRVASVVLGAPPSANGVRHLTTPRGRVVVLPRSDRMLTPEQQVLLRRAAMIGGGILAGLATIGSIVAFARWLALNRSSLDSTDNSSDA